MGAGGAGEGAASSVRWWEEGSFPDPEGNHGPESWAKAIQVRLSLLRSRAAVGAGSQEATRGHRTAKEETGGRFLLLRSCFLLPSCRAFLTTALTSSLLLTKQSSAAAPGLTLGQTLDFSSPTPTEGPDGVLLGVLVANVIEITGSQI